LGWLNAIPKPDEGSKDKRPEISRLDAMKKSKIPILMPPNPVPIITDQLIELGLTEAAGMGLAPLSWTTIDAWQRVTGVRLSPGTARLIRHLSAEYVAERRRAESEHCPAPWLAEVSEREREVEQAGLEALLG